MAEGVGFEPTVPIRHNGFRDRPIRPLWHPSADGAADRTRRPDARQDRQTTWDRPNRPTTLACAVIRS